MHSWRRAYLQPVRYLRQTRDSWLLVNEFPLVQISELGSVETDSEIGSKHPLMALDRQTDRQTEDYILDLTPPDNPAASNPSRTFINKDSFQEQFSLFFQRISQIQN